MSTLDDKIDEHTREQDRQQRECEESVQREADDALAAKAAKVRAELVVYEAIERFGSYWPGDY